MDQLATSRRDAIRVDLQAIADMVGHGSRVLDVGCGNGDLLDHLVHDKGVDGRGIELSQKGVNACVSRGLSVVQGDANRDLSNYPDGSFDYTVLSQTLQVTREPRAVLMQLLRIGRCAIVSFPNFGYWRVRWGLFWHGRMPTSQYLPGAWHETPNIHPCTIRDFVDLCDELGIIVERGVSIDRHGRAKAFRAPPSAAVNRGAELAVFVLSRP